jgi:hypothetical protein
MLILFASIIGDLWSGSEGGIIKVWYGEAIEKSLALQREEKCKTPLLVERSFIDLWTMVSDGGACPLPAVDVKLLVSDNSRSKVWSGGYLSFALWYTSCVHLFLLLNWADICPAVRIFVFILVLYFAI